jgi:type IV pilus assembly protein PilB
MYVNQDQLKEFILDSGLISADEWDEAAELAQERDARVGTVLVNEGYISEDDLRQMQAYVLGVPYVDLKDKDIDFDTLKLIPEPIARNHNIIAYNQHDNVLEVAMLDTDDLTAIEFLKKKLDMKIEPRVTDNESIKKALMQYQKTLKDEFGDIIQRETESLEAIPEEAEQEEDVSPDDLKEMAEDLPVVRIVNTLLKHAIIQNASDIHIEPLENELLIRYRIDGILHDAMTLPKSAAATIVARVKVLANLKLDEKRLPQDGRFKMEVNGQKVSFRVSILPTYHGEKIVMRLLKQNIGGFTLEGLGFHGVGLEAVHSATKEKTGMILTTGPTGSGKTTTLYTVLDILSTPEVNISTIEDPVEYQMSRINQTQVKPDIGFTFAQGLRALVRQDPDIVMVGEIRDNETAGLAVNAALTGHLVLSTLHTNSAAGAVPRLLDMQVEPFLLVSTLKVVIGQRLVRKLCDEKEEYTLSTEEVDQIAESVNVDRVVQTLKDENVIGQDDSLDSITFYKPKSTEKCEDGYSGRVGIYEVLSISEPIKDLVVQEAATEDIEQQARKDGMITMLEDGIFKAAQGQTSIEEVLRVVNE